MSRGQIFGLSFLVTLLVFVLDVFLPLGVAEAVPYVAVVLIALRSPEKRDPLLAAAVCSFLTLLGYFLSPKGAQAWVALSNRGIALFAIWATAVLAMQIRESNDAIRAQSQMLTGILKHMPTVAFKLDEQGYMKESIGKGLKRIGLSDTSSVGRNALEPGPEIRAQIENNQSQEVISYESHGVYQGSPWWFLTCLSPDEVEGKGNIGFAIDITERKKVERRLAAHDAVARTLSEFTSLNEAALQILEAICQSLVWELGALWEVDPQKNVLRCVEVWHAPWTQLKEFILTTKESIFARGVGFPGHVWEREEPLWLTDITQDSKFPRSSLASKEGLHAAFGIPITLDGNTVGVMEFFSKQIEEPDESLLQMFSAIGRQIGHFIEREQKDRRLSAHYAVTKVLADSTSLTHATPHILEVICETLGWAFGAIWKIDESSESLRCVEVYHAHSAHLDEFENISKQTTFPLGVGLPGRVWESGQPAWIIDVVKDKNFPRAPIAAKEGLHAAFAFPIKIGTTVLGVMEFFHRETQEPDKELLQMFGAIGIQVGQFIQRTAIGL